MLHLVNQCEPRPAPCGKRSRNLSPKENPMRTVTRITLLAALLTTFPHLAGATQDEKKVELSVGDAAPAFQSTDDQGLTWKSPDHLGKKYIVVYFYPGDFTPGCTAQAKKFQENMNKLHDQKAEVVGVSGDSAKTHAMFKQAHKLTFTLVADENGSLAKRFGVPVGPGAEVRTKDADKKQLTFKREVTTARWTFVIGLDGNIIYKNMKVNPVEDSKQVAAILEKLEKK